MALGLGSRLGPYDIIALLGEGGMGQVYRATDTNLKRAVALKVLPESVAADADRLARFQREAEVLAALNHPNIAAIYGVERPAGSPVLVMELVEGPTLADRIASGPLAPDDIRLIARQIAEALEAAHDRGIVHRDLKPANIKVRPDDTVKVLDFGLAKQGDRSGSASGGPTSSQVTMTSPAMTQAGMILGTAAYMSPEQAKGRAVDRRADVWAFGAVLYEMLTGQRAFAGDDVTEVLASVLAREPDWSRLPASTLILNAVVRRCLERDPRQRFGDMQSVRLALDGAFGSGVASAAAVGSDHGPANRKLWPASATWPWLIAGASLVAAITFGTIYLNRPPSDHALIKTTIGPPDGAVFDFDVTAGPPVLSPNGKYVAFSARSADNRIQLWLRPLDSTDARPIEGTDGAAFPFWSPDSQSLGFYDTPKGRLERVDLAGGAPIPIASAGYVRGASWGPDNTIVYDASDRGGGIFEVPVSGGTPKQVIADGFPRSPWFLPDGQHFLYHVREKTPAVHVASRDGKTDAVVTEATTGAIYANGRLLFMRENTLLAQPFDVSRLEVTGAPVAIARGVQIVLGEPHGLFSASENGLLVYQDAPSGPASTLIWFDASGKRQAVVADMGSARGVRLSPDGQSTVIGLSDAQGRIDLWRTELSTGRQTRLTFANDGDVSPFCAWASDGQWLAYGVKRDGRTLIVRRPSAGGTEEVVASVPPALMNNLAPRVTGWAANGGDIVFSSTSIGGIWRVPSIAAAASARGLTPVVKDPESAQNARLSPDQRWVAYQAVLGGASTNTVLVEAFPGGGHRHQVSDRATLPVWSVDGRALYYASDNMLTMVSVTEAEGTLQFGPPRPLMPVIIGRGFSYDVGKDGRILALVTSAARAARPLTLVQGWVR